MLFHKDDWLRADEIREVYSGPVTLKGITEELHFADANLTFKWFPRIGVRLAAKIEEKDWIFDDETEFAVFADGFKVGDFHIESLWTSNTSSELSIYAESYGQVVLGDKSIDVTKVEFYVPNLKRFIYSEKEKSIHHYQNDFRNDLVLSDGKYHIQFLINPDYDGEVSDLRYSGGFAPLYSGYIRRDDDGPISYQNLEEIRARLRYFLSFLNGDWTSILMLEGIHDGNVIWSDWSPQIISSFRESESWIEETSIHGIPELYSAFCSHHKDTVGWDALTSAITWYIESNNLSGTTNGALVMAQACLELLYNWIVVEKNQLIIGPDNERIRAASKIRLLCSFLDEDSKQVLDTYSSLDGLISENKPIDKYEAITQIRNGVVHGQLSKRIEGQKYDDDFRSKALQLCLFIIEMSILNLCEYSGESISRLSNETGTI